MKNGRRILSILLLISLLLPMLPVLPLTAFAAKTPKTDAMEEIEASDELAAYRQGETQRFEDDGYIGIPYEVTVYYDYATHGKAVAAHVTLGGTPVILYVVNANVERIGTDSDVSIIRSMIDRGFVVAVLDYLNDDLAKSPDLDFSAQSLRASLAAGKYFADADVFASGTYADNLIVPAGYDVKFNDVFFELDKHGTDGTLERIVNVWNNDFRKYHKDKTVKWVHADGTRKATQKDFSGNAPVWYADAEGKTVDAENGTYTKVKWTLAETVTDCVKADGSPIDFNLYIHTIYPTNPEKDVPVMTMFSSSGYLVNGSSTVARPQMQGFLFDGYAGVLFDYAWIPMGRNDHYGYFDGSSGDSSVTGDNQSYATYTFNASQVATAAMRYTRYLALSDHDTYRFDIDAVGVFGISKAAWMTQLGAPILREDLYTPADGDPATVEQLVNDKINSFYQQLWLPDHHGESRYDNGITETYEKDGMTVDGGALQPWAVYDGYEISSGAQMVYSSCGASIDYFSEGYSPQFITENLQDTYNTEYGRQNDMVNLCRNLDIPALWYEADIAHTFAEGLDYRYGVDIYMAFRKFADYYLKGSAVSVTYTDPMNGAVISTTDSITVKFIGDATVSEIAKITVTDAKGNAASGTWESAYGDTEWTFTPNALTGGETYTLVIPADFAGKNGAAMGESYVATFYTRPEGASSEVLGDTVISKAGTPISVTVPAFDGADSFALRVRVTNDAANKLLAYTESGKLIGSVRVSGIGFYEIDLTEALSSYAEGETVNLILRTESASGNVLTYTEDFNEGRGDFTTSSYNEYTNAQSIAGETALKIVRKTNKGKFDGDYWFYSNGTVLTNKKIINGGSAVTRADMGRRFEIKLRLYDTASRRIQLSMNSATSKDAKLLDFDRVIYTEGTEENAWNEYVIPYTVYESEYALSHQKIFYLQINPTGDTEMPIYVDQFDVYEVFTDVSVASAAIVSRRDSEFTVKAPVSENAFSVGGTEYATWKDAMNAATEGATVTMLRSYTLTDADVVSLGGKKTLTVDLGGYRLTANNTSKAPVLIAATDASALTLTLKNGSVLLGATPLVSWNGSSKAGSGKQVALVLEGIYLANRESFPQLSFFSESQISNAAVDCDVTLRDCVIDIDRYELPNRDTVIFTAGTGLLSMSYTFEGGKLIINDVHDVALSESIIDVKENASGEYVKLLTPVSEGTPVISMRNETGYASPAKTGTENGYIVFSPADAVNTTPYGAIPDKYADADRYPFVVFADGVCIAAENTLNAATQRAQAHMEAKNGSTVQIVLARDFNNAGTKGGYLAELNGTLVLDLGGHVLTRNETVFEGVVSDKYASNYDTALVIRNGAFLTANATGSGHVIAFESKGKTEKNYSIRFEGITFALASGSEAGYLVTRCWGGSGEAVNVDMTLVDCTFDFSGKTPGSKAPTASVNVFHLSNVLVKADVRVVGGKIYAPDASLTNVTWSALNSDDAVSFERDESDSYVTAFLPHGVTPTFSVPSEDGALPCNKLLESGEVYDLYTLTNDSVRTEYGTIPPANTGNVFVLFMNGKFVGGKDEWKDIQNLIRTTLDANKGATVTVLMRQDHTHDAGNIGTSDRIPFMNGTVVVDLGGYTLTSSKTLFELGVSKEAVYETSYTVKNGYINVRSGNLFASESRSNYDKHVTLTFSDVEINVDTTAKNVLFVTYGDTSSGVTYTGKNELDILFDNATLDLRGFTADKMTVFNFGNSASCVRANATFKGGKILMDDEEKVTFSNLCGGKDTLTFVPDESGKYTSLSLDAGSTLPEIGGLNEKGDGVLFAGGVASGERTVYSLTENDRVTAYGIIPTDYASVSSYPFVIFGKGGFLAAYENWGKATDGMRSNLNNSKGGTVAVLVRADYTGNDSTTYLGRMMGTVIIDLDGHTMGRVNNSLLEFGTKAMTETESKYVANILIKNGRLHAGRTDNANGHLFTMQAYVNYDKTINVTFENVTFAAIDGMEKGLTALAVRGYGASGDATGIITSELRFVDCVFDFSGTAGTSVPSSTTLVHLSSGGTSQNVSVVFEGGKIVGTTQGITLTSVDASDKVTYRKNAAGSYFILDLPENKNTITTALSTDVGEMFFVRESTAKVDDVTRHYFELGQKLDDCDGAVVPYRYSSNPEKYPYVFVQNGKFVAAREDWKGGTTIAIAYVDNVGDEEKSAVLYLVRDITEMTNGTLLDGIRGKLIVDLNGYTLTATQTLFEGKSSQAHTSTVEVKDGTIVINRTGNTSIIALERAERDGFGEGAVKELLLSFTGVTFRYAEGATTKNPLVVTWAGSGEGRLAAHLTFNGCTFDMRAATTGINLINANNAPLTDVIAVINGGELLLPKSSLVTWLGGANEGDSLTLGELDGAYPTLSIASGNAPTDLFRDTEGNARYFVSNGNGGFELVSVPARITGASVGLGTHISVLYYLTVAEDLVIDTEKLSAVFTVNGERVSVTDFRFENGEYIFELAGFAPKQLADRIDVEILVGDLVIASHGDYSIKENLLNLLDKGAEGLGMSDGEFASLKALIEDLLRYGAAAQSYLDYNTDTPILEGVDTDSMGEQTLPDGTDAVTVDGNEDPSFTFIGIDATFGATNEIYFNVMLDGDASLAGVRVDGVLYALSDLEDLGDGCYRIAFKEIMAQDFSRMHRVELYYNEALTVGISFSTNAYVTEMAQFSQDEKMQALANALYSYARSAENYLDALAISE